MTGKPPLIRLSRASVGEDEKRALARAIDDGYLGMGEEVRLFEQELGAYFGGGRHVVATATGTAALHLAVVCLDLGPGDEVLVPTITFVACFQSVRATGATPVACDVRAHDVFLDLADAERRLTPRTRAIMPVHYASSAVGLDEVYAFAHAHGLRVIEDAAHAFGGTRGGRKVGSTGDIVCFSFDGIKNITCGEGGAVVTGDDALAQRLRDARLVGVERDTEARYAARRSWTFDVHHQGFRYHMSNLMAAVGRTQLGRLEDFIVRRRQLAARYRRELGALNALSVLTLDWDEIVPHIFVVRVHESFRDALGEWLKERGIETGFHYQPNHRLSYFASSEPLPAAEALANELLTLPLHAELTDDEQTRVIGAVKEFFGLH